MHDSVNGIVVVVAGSVVDDVVVVSAAAVVEARSVSSGASGAELAVAGEVSGSGAVLTVSSVVDDSLAEHAARKQAVTKAIDTATRESPKQRGRAQVTIKRH